MSRDWMTIGRRPSGLCGAAIIIAARFIGYKIDVSDVIDVVHVCDETIKKKLIEFNNTNVALFTKEEFEDFKLDDSYIASNPPAFSKNRTKEETKTFLEVGAKQIEKYFKEEEKIIDVCDEKKISLFANKSNNSITENGANKNDEEELSDIEDKDTYYYISSVQEYQLKKTLWEIVNKNWIDEQETKMKKLRGNNKNISKKRERDVTIENNHINKTPYEAIKNSSSKKFGKKINYGHIKKIFSKDK